MRRLFVFAAALALLGACQQPAPAPKADAPKAAAPAPDAAPALPLGAFTVSGTAKIQDAGYPNFHVIVTPATGAPVEMIWMAEDDAVAVTPKNAEPEAFNGKAVEVSYERIATNQMFDLTENGKSLLMKDADAPKTPDRPTKTTTGLLIAPDRLTGGDLPDTLTIKGATGGEITVEHFVIEDAILKAAGKTVTLTYFDDQDTNLTGIRLLTPAAKK